MNRTCPANCHPGDVVGSHRYWIGIGATRLAYHAMVQKLFIAVVALLVLICFIEVLLGGPGMVSLKPITVVGRKKVTVAAYFFLGGIISDPTKRC